MNTGKVLFALVAAINFLIGSNYMFTFQKPDGLNFTLLMPDWPYYFLIMRCIGLSFYTLMMIVSLILIKKTK